MSPPGFTRRGDSTAHLHSQDALAAATAEPVTLRQKLKQLQERKIDTDLRAYFSQDG